LFQRKWFTEREWAVSTEQPPSLANPSGRRVDLVVERLDEHSNSQTCLFMEAKHHGASPTHVVKGHCQAWDAA
ncbi:hypothetical protein F5883DRAFT_357351, partial [Diaporthe sp. PMI_573]